ncbi:MAG: hypothetical protein ACKVQU_16520 [Burkholderiales bacterium]
MAKFYPVAMATAIACAMPHVSHAQSRDELTDFRNQIQRIKEEYEARIQALEKRFAEAEAKRAQAEQNAKGARAKAVGAQPSDAAASQQDRQSAFNPAISLIMQGRNANLSQSPDTYRIGGFMPSGTGGPGPRGLSLSETELAISAAVDPYFSGHFTGALAPEGGFEVENAYFQTTAVGRGFTLKGGRYFSEIGYLNKQHQHSWDFIDAPLPYRVFLGGQLGNDGVQIKWIAPTDVLLAFGAEAANGRSFPGGEHNRNSPRLTSFFGHVGGDLGVSHSWRTGLSYLQAAPDDRRYQDLDSAGVGVTNSFAGRSKLWIADFVWKWAPEGNPTSRNIKFQAEYMLRNEDGRLTFDTDAAAAGPLQGSYSSRQRGWYAQATYQFMPRWRLGARYDRVDSGTPRIGQVTDGALAAADFPTLASHRPSIATAMVDWSPSEFSRLRLQYARDRSRPDAIDHQIYLQYIMSFGAHGAHAW